MKLRLITTPLQNIYIHKLHVWSLYIGTLLGVLSISSCDCKGGNEKLPATLRFHLAQNVVQGKEKISITVKNECSIGEPGVDLSNYRVSATIKSDNTQSELAYLNRDQVQVKQKSIDVMLTDLQEAQTLESQEERLVQIGVKPKKGIDSLTVVLALIKKQAEGDEEVMQTEEVVWHASLQPQLLIDNIIHADGSGEGSFIIKAPGSSIDPTKVAATWESSSSSAELQVNGKNIQDIKTLADLLDRTDRLPAGSISKPIPFLITKQGSKPKLVIQLKLQENGRVLTTGKLRWEQKKADFVFGGLQYDAKHKKIVYQVVKNPGVTVQNTRIEFKNINSASKAQLAAGGKPIQAPILLQEANFIGHVSSGALSVKFNKEEQATFEFTIYHNNQPVVTKRVHVSKAQLSISRIIRHKDDHGQYIALAYIKNVGRKTAKDVSISYKAANQGTIAGLKNGSKDHIQIPVDSKLSHRVDLGVLDFEGLETVEFTFSLYHHGVLIEERNIGLNLKDIIPCFKELYYDADKKQINYAIINQGNEAVMEHDHLTLEYETADDIKVEGERKGIKKIINLPARQEGYKVEKLAVDLQDEFKAKVRFVLNLNGHTVAFKTITCQEDVQMAFVDKEPITLKGYQPKKIKHKLQIKNEGKHPINKKYFQIRLTKIAGPTAHINGTALGINQSMDLSVAQSLEPGKAADLLKLKIDSKSDAFVQMELQITYKGHLLPIPSKTIIWEKEAVELDFTQAGNIDLYAQEKVFQIGLTNHGKDPAAYQFVGLRVTKNTDQEIILCGKTINNNGVSIDIPYDKFNLKKNIEQNGHTGDLQLKLDPLKNKEVTLTLQPLYGGDKMGNPKTVVWKKVPELAFIASANLHENINQGDLKLTFQNLSDRTLDEKDLQAMTVHYGEALVGDKQMAYDPGFREPVNGHPRSLADLLKVHAIQANEKFDLIVHVKRSTNEEKKFKDFKIKYNNQEELTPKNFESKWPQAPKLVLSAKIKGNTLKLILKNVSQFIPEANLKHIQLKYSCTEQNSDTKRPGKLIKEQVGDVNGREWPDILGVKLNKLQKLFIESGVDGQRTVKLNLEAFDPGATKITIFLEGPVESEPLVIVWNK